MDKIICYCKNISEAEIRSAMENGATSLQDIKDTTGACTGSDCKTLNPTGKCCADDIRQILGEQKSEKPKCCCCG